MDPQQLPRADQRKVIAKAFYRATDALALDRRDIEAMLGISQATISRHVNSAAGVQMDPKTNEIALIFLRIYRSLLAIMGGSDENARKWFDANNTFLGGKPRDLVKGLQGMVDVVEYLDAMRGKV